MPERERLCASSVRCCAKEAVISERESHEEGRRVEAVAKPPLRIGLVGYLVELCLPTLLVATALLAVASYLRFWNLGSVVGIAIFGVLLVILSLFFSARIDLITLERRRARGTRRLLNRTSSAARLVKLALGGVVIPVALLIVANQWDLGGHRTPMSLAVRMAIQWRLAGTDSSRAEQIGDLVLHSDSAAVKAQGMAALAALNTPEALKQLVRVLDVHAAALKDAAQRQALSRAFAAFGAKAVPPLVQRLNAVPADLRRAAAAAEGDRFDRYFSAAFDGVKGEVAGGHLDPVTRAARLAQIETAQHELERELSRIERDPQATAADNGLPAFVMTTFLRMDTRQDAALLAFAKQTAADAAWSDAVRGQALLLIAKLGSKDDVKGLYAYLDSGSATLQARALQSIAFLQAQGAPASAKP